MTTQPRTRQHPERIPQIVKRLMVKVHELGGFVAMTEADFWGYRGVVKPARELGLMTFRRVWGDGAWDGCRLTTIRVTHKGVQALRG